jgi:hypothetical protein
VKNGNCTNHNINQAPENSNQPPQKKIPMLLSGPLKILRKIYKGSRTNA